MKPVTAKTEAFAAELVATYGLAKVRAAVAITGRSHGALSRAAKLLKRWQQFEPKNPRKRAAYWQEKGIVDG